MTRTRLVEPRLTANRMIPRVSRSARLYHALARAECYTDRMTTITTKALADLFDTTPKTIADLGKRDLIASAGARGKWELEASVTGYVRHLLRRVNPVTLAL